MGGGPLFCWLLDDGPPLRPEGQKLQLLGLLHHRRLGVTLQCWAHRRILILLSLLRLYLWSVYRANIFAEVHLLIAVYWAELAQSLLEHGLPMLLGVALPPVSFIVILNGLIKIVASPQDHWASLACWSLLGDILRWVISLIIITLVMVVIARAVHVWSLQHESPLGPATRGLEVLRNRLTVHLENWVRRMILLLSTLDLLLSYEVICVRLVHLHILWNTHWLMLLRSGWQWIIVIQIHCVIHVSNFVWFLCVLPKSVDVVLILIGPLLFKHLLGIK